MSSTISSGKLPRSFGRLNITQFLGAMNDNILKLLIIFCLIGVQGSNRAGFITATVGASFVLPFLLFSAPAGCLADRFRKSEVIVLVKLAEVVVTALAVAAFYFGWYNGLYLVIFMMAAHSAFFAPAKYGIIPELAAHEQLSRANGVIESFTYLAIIFGTVLASALTQLANGRYWIAALFCLGVAITGVWSASGMEATPQADASRNVSLFPMEIVRTILSNYHDRDLVMALFGQAYFMFVGAYVQLNLIGYGIQEIGLSEVQSGYLFLGAALGIGIGSVLAAKLSVCDVELGLVPIGAIGLTVSLILLYAVPASLVACLVIVVILGISAGLFSLPLQTFIQYRARPEQRGEVLAAASFINWVAILIASGMTWLFSSSLGLRAAQGFSIVGGITLVVTLIALWGMPNLLSRFITLITMTDNG